MDSYGVVTVRGIFPFLKREEVFVVDVTSKYKDLISMFCEELDEDNSAIVLSILDVNGWNIYVRNEIDNELFCVINDIYPSASRSTCLLEDLKDDDCVVLSRTADSVRPRRLLPCLLQEILMYQVLTLLRILDDDQLHSVITKQIKALESTFLENSSPGLSRGYCGYRNLRSGLSYGDDGNSYYRAVYFSLFEQIIIHNRHHLFGHLHDLFRTHGFMTDGGVAADEVEFDEDFEEFLTTLNCAANKSIWRTCEELEHDVLSSDSCFDIACVQAVRHLTSNFIRTHAKCRIREKGTKLFSGPTLEERLVRRHCDIQSLDQFCKLAVEDMGVDVDDLVLELGLVLCALQCTGSLVLVGDFADVSSDEDLVSQPDELLYSISTVETPHYAGGAHGAWAKAPCHLLFGHISVSRRTSEVKDISEAFIGVGAQAKVARTPHVQDYALAADQGNAHAAFMLAQRYDAGDGVPEDKLSAAKYYKIAADQGNADAQFMLGMLLDIGDGVPQNESEALKYYKMAASRGNANAQKVLAEFNDGSGHVDTTFLRNKNGCYTYSVLYPSQFFSKNYMDMRRTLQQQPAVLEPLSEDDQLKWAKRNARTRSNSHEHQSPAHSNWAALRAAVVSGHQQDNWSIIAHSISSTTTWSTTSPMKRSAEPFLLSPVPPLVTASSSSSNAPRQFPEIDFPLKSVSVSEKTVGAQSEQDSSNFFGGDLGDEEQNQAASVLQARVRGANARKALQKEVEAKEQHQAASVLQARVRGANARKALQKEVEAKEQHRAAMILQARVRGANTRKTLQEEEEKARRLEQEKLERFHRLRKAHQAEEAVMKRIKSFNIDDEVDSTELDTRVRELVTSKKPVVTTLPVGVFDVPQEAWEEALARKLAAEEKEARPTKVVSEVKTSTPGKAKSPRAFFPDSSDDEGDSALKKWERESQLLSDPPKPPARPQVFFPDGFDKNEHVAVNVAGQSPSGVGASTDVKKTSTALVVVDDQVSVSSVSTVDVKAPASPLARALSRGMSARMQLTALIRADSLPKLTTAKSFFNSLIEKKTNVTRKKSKTDLLLEDIRMIDEIDSDWDSVSSYSSYDVDEPIWDEEFEPNKFEEAFILISRICRNLVNKKIFGNFITLNIVAAVIVIGYQTYPQYENDPTLNAIDVAIFSIFTIEVAFKILAEEFRPWLYFTRKETRAWNWFDFLIVVSGMPIPGSTNLKFLRIARLLRLTKVFKKFPQLNMIVLGIVDSTSFLLYIVALWFMMQYMYAVLGIFMFAENDPWHFQSLEYAVFTLLQMTILDFWGEVMMVNVYGCHEYPSIFYTSDPERGTHIVGDLMLCDHPQANPLLASAYFVSYITISAFCIVPFFIAAMFISMADCVERMKIESKLQHRKHCLRKLKYEEENISNLALLNSRTKLDIQLTRLAFAGKEITDEINLNPVEYPHYYAAWYISLLGKYNVLALWCLDFSETRRFRRIVTGAIILAGIMLGIETVPSSSDYQDSLDIIEITVQTVFSIEVVLKIIAEGDCPYMYFASWWNIFDFIVVAGSFVQSNNQILIMRLLRLFRVFKLAKELKQLQVIMKGATRGLAAAGYIMLIIYITIFVFAIVANLLFSSNDPASWGQLHIAMIVLTQMILHDNWINYASTIMLGCDLQPSPLQFDESECDKPHAQFFLGYIFVLMFTVYGSYILMALFIGSIHVAMEEEQYNQCEEDIVQDAVAVISRKRRLKKLAVQRFHQVFKLLDVTESDRIGKEELLFGLHVAKEDNITSEDLNCLFELIDKDDSGELDFGEFILFMLDLRNLQLRQREEKEEDMLTDSPASPNAASRSRRKSTISMSLEIVKSRLERGGSVKDVSGSAMRRGSVTGDGSLSPTLESQGTWKAKLKRGAASAKSGKNKSSEEFLDSLISPSEFDKHHKRNKWGKKQTMQHTDSVANIMAAIDQELEKVDPQHHKHNSEPINLKKNAWGTAKDLRVVTEEEPHAGILSHAMDAAGFVGGSLIRKATMSIGTHDAASEGDNHSLGQNSDSHGELTPRHGHHQSGSGGSGSEHSPRHRRMSSAPTPGAHGEHKHHHHHHSDGEHKHHHHHSDHSEGEHKHHHHHHHSDHSDSEHKHHHHHHHSEGEHKHHHHHHHSDHSEGEHKHHHHHHHSDHGSSENSPARKSSSAPAAHSQSFFGGRASAPMSPKTSVHNRSFSGSGKGPPSRTASENSTSESSKG